MGCPEERGGAIGAGGVDVDRLVQQGADGLCVLRCRSVH